MSVNWKSHMDVGSVLGFKALQSRRSNIAAALHGPGEGKERALPQVWGCTPCQCPHPLVSSTPLSAVIDSPGGILKSV